MNMFSKWLLYLIILAGFLSQHFVPGLGAQEIPPPLEPKPAETEPVRAAEPAPVQRSVAEDLERSRPELTITVDWVDKSLREALRYLAEKAGVTIIPDLAITERDRVTVTFHNLAWRKALTEVCRLTKCVLTETSPNLFRVGKPPLLTLKTKTEGAPIETVIARIAEIAGVSIIIATDVKGTVAFSFKNVPLMNALEHIVKTAGFVLVQEEHNVIRIIRPEAMAAQLETRVFLLKYLRPPEAYRAKIDVGAYAVGAPKIPDPITEFTLLTILQNMLSPNGKLQYDAVSNAIIVKDTKPALDEIEKVLNKLDVEPALIMFDVKIINTQNTELLEFGIKYTSGAEDAGLTITSVPKASPDYTERRTRGPFGTGPEYPPPGPGAGFDMAFLTNFDVTASLRLFKKDLRSRLAQRPSVLTLDGKEATITVGETIHYAETKATATQAGGLEYSIAEASKSPVDIGFQLLVIPHIVKGTNKIMLTVLPQDKFLTGSTSKVVPGFEHFEVSMTGGTQSVELPRFRQTTLVTHLIIESGQTAVIGGLTTDRSSKTTHKIPFLGDLPILAPLFRYTSDSLIRDHLLIYITPTIVRRAEESQDIFKKRIEEMEGLAPGAEKSRRPAGRPE